MREEIKFQIAHQAENSVPFECCGIITGDGFVVPCMNAAKDRTQSFSMLSNEVNRIARRHGIAGYYHSHVGAPAIPSSSDSAGGSYPGKLYVIASVIQGVCREVRVYRFTEDGFQLEE
jgi:proteasome lid subunit RPN8/RPN11